MDLSGNLYDENIRSPDPVINERLIEDTKTFEEKQLDEAIYNSLQEIQCIQKEMEIYEKKIISDYQNETIRRKDLFSDFLLNVNRTAAFDKEIKEIYNIIEPIITLYCEQYIEKHEFDEVTYDKIFKTLSTIRMKKTDIENVKTILLKNII
jgi:hypothetical protein